MTRKLLLSDTIQACLLCVQSTGSNSKVQMFFGESSAMWYIFIVFSVTSLYQTHAIMNQDLSFDLKDILSGSLMPMSIINIKNSGENARIDRMSSRNMFRPAIVSDFNSAFKLMQYHRDMIKNFKCKKYIAHNILQDIAPLAFKNRLGIANTNSNGNYLNPRGKYLI